MVYALVTESWPNALDLTITIAILTVFFLLPAAGYVFMVLDFRAYLRSLRRSLARMGESIPVVPYWARAETPRAIAALGLRLPCTQEDLKHAYRKRVKQLHPDHGGDERRFLLLQAQFEEALAILAGPAPQGYAPLPGQQR